MPWICTCIINQMSTEQHSPAHEWQQPTHLDRRRHICALTILSSSSFCSNVMGTIFRTCGRNRWPSVWRGLVWPSGACSAFSSPGNRRSAETVGNASDNILRCCSLLWEILDSAHSYPLFVFQRVVLIHGVLLREKDWSQQQVQWNKNFSHAVVHYLQIMHHNQQERSIVRNKSGTHLSPSLFELIFTFL